MKHRFELPANWSSDASLVPQSVYVADGHILTTTNRNTTLMLVSWDRGDEGVKCEAIYESIGWNMAWCWDPLTRTIYILDGGMANALNGHFSSIRLSLALPPNIGLRKDVRMVAKALQGKWCDLRLPVLSPNREASVVFDSERRRLHYLEACSERPLLISGPVDDVQDQILSVHLDGSYQHYRLLFLPTSMQTDTSLAKMAPIRPRHIKRVVRPIEWQEDLFVTNRHQYVFDALGRASDLKTKLEFPYLVHSVAFHPMTAEVVRLVQDFQKYSFFIEIHNGQEGWNLRTAKQCITNYVDDCLAPVFGAVLPRGVQSIVAEFLIVPLF